MPTPSYIALLVAGGSGTRMGAAEPKQFLLLAGQPVLLHTLRCFAEAVPAAELVVVLPAAHRARWQELLADIDPARVPPHRVVSGGATRLASVRAGLRALGPQPAGTLVAVHDGVRPLVPVAVIRAAYAAAQAHGAAVPVVALKDSVRRVRADGSSVAEDRTALQLVQTPQCFQLAALRAAYAAAPDDHDPALTDDASVAERAGQAITLVAGSYENLKITTPEDLLLAEAVLRSRLLNELAGS